MLLWWNHVYLSKLLIVTYRKCTNFDKGKFIDEISLNLRKHNLQELTLEAFVSMFETVFEKHTPLKNKYLRANYSKFVTEELSKATMLRSKLRKRCKNRGANTKNKESLVYIY